MRLRWAFCLCNSISFAACVVVSSASAVGAVVVPTTIYVDPSGDDANSGASIDRPVRSFDKAIQKSRTSRRPVEIQITGRFDVHSPVVLDARDQGLTIKARPGGRASLVGMSGTKFGIVVKNSSGITISDLTFSNFTNDAISIHDASSVHVAGNKVMNIASDAWSQGAIHFSGNVQGALIERNVVNGAGYAGIIIDTDTASNLSNLTISNNKVSNVCQKVADCGAIYVNDRTKSSKNILVYHNYIYNFGSGYTKGRGIYLDDFASNIVISSNVIAGTGTYAFQIHGGHDNKIVGNMVDMSSIKQIILYQPISYLSWDNMTANVMKNNVFKYLHGRRLEDGNSRLLMPKSYSLLSVQNKLCDARTC